MGEGITRRDTLMIGAAIFIAPAIIGQEKSEVSCEEEFDARVARMSGLSIPQSRMYYPFCHHADFDSGVITYGDVEHDLWDLVRRGIDTMTPNTHACTRSKTYDFWLSSFREKELISRKEYVVIQGDPENPVRYPILKGYNPFNDPEIYVMYRRVGEERWSGRISRAHLEKVGREVDYEYKLPEQKLA